MNKRQQLEKLGNQLNETFKQYVELAIQVEIEEKIERTLNELFDNLEKICNGEEIVEDSTANQKPEPTVIDMLMRYKNFIEEIETSDDEDDEEYEDDEEDEEEIIDVSEEEFFRNVSEEEFKDFLQLLKKIEVLKQ
jgi:hypothetical protein